MYYYYIYVEISTTRRDIFEEMLYCVYANIYNLNFFAKTA